jgi:UDPglucose--hexose-1-phosphate uridylyltransferase
MAEFRKDPITGRWVIIATQRARRPRQLGASNHGQQAEPCPFCAGNEAMTPPELWALRDANTQANAPGWNVRVVPNKYPALESDSQWTGFSDNFYQAQNGVGAHEVIVESAEHVVNIGALSEVGITNVLRAYRERMRSLRMDRRWRYLLLYKNQGDRAGATLEHIHSQLIALPHVPSEAADEINGAQAHYLTAKRCIYCEIIEGETAASKRVIYSHAKFVALCPFAPRFAYESWILPRTHAAAFEESSDRDLDDFGRALHEIIARLNRALDDPPFNYFLHSAPTDDSISPHYHWHWEILPQLSRAAGFELGSGSHINSVAPEDAAKLLRDVLL